MTTDLRGYAFLIEVLGTAGAVPLGGFTEAFGLADGAASATRSAALKRGLASASVLLSLQGAGARPTVVVTMRDERANVVRRWKLAGARITKYVGPTLNAKGTDVAIEELVLAADSITSG
jgi:phage tail-like protein